MSDQSTTIDLSAGRLVCLISPTCGGSITRFALTGDGRQPTDLMRPAEAGAVSPCDPLKLSCWPLVPFSNRVGYGRFQFDGQDIEMRENMLPEPHMIHGHGWQSSWDVTHRSRSNAVLTMEYPGGEWPFAYQATERFELLEDRLVVGLDLTNEADRPMPAGLGLHPYFPRHDGLRMQANVDHVWLNDDVMLPERKVALPERWPLPTGLLVSDDNPIDNCFGGWDGTARLTWDSLGLAMTISAEGPFGHLIAFAPPGSDYACLEPVTNLSNGFKMMPGDRDPGETGVVILETGETLSATVTFQIHLD